MNRAQFIKELERLLSDLPYGERQEAIQYYNDYFDDAGPEKEAQVIAELGSPAKVAKTIREGMSEGGEYTERGYEDARFRQAQELSSEWKKPEEPQDFNRCKGANPWKFFSILLLCLLLFPIILPLFLAFLGVIAAVILGIFQVRSDCGRSGGRSGTAPGRTAFNRDCRLQSLFPSRNRHYVRRHRLSAALRRHSALFADCVVCKDHPSSLHPKYRIHHSLST